MLLRVSRTSLAIALLCVTSTAEAGTFQVAVRNADGDVGTEQATLDGADLDLKSVGRGAFTFAFPEGQVSARLNISADAAFKVTVMVPYFWDDSLVRPIAAAITPDPIPTVRYYRLTRIGSQLLRGPLVDQMLLNQETRLIFRRVSESGLPLTPDDIKLISFFVISSKELVLNNSVVADDEMRRAVGVLEDALPQREMFESKAALDNAIVAIGQFRGADFARMLKLVNRLSGDAAGTPPGGPMCRAVRSLQSSLEDMADNDEAFDEAHGLRLRNNTTLAECAGRALAADADVSQAELESNLELAHDVVVGMGADLVAYREARSNQPDDTPARNANSRLIELRGFLSYHVTSD
jgi:hypothetical protein